MLCCICALMPYAFHRRIVPHACIHKRMVYPNFTQADSTLQAASSSADDEEEEGDDEDDEEEEQEEQPAAKKAKVNSSRNAVVFSKNALLFTWLVLLLLVVTCICRLLVLLNKIEGQSTYTRSHSAPW